MEHIGLRCASKAAAVVAERYSKLVRSMSCAVSDLAAFKRSLQKAGRTHSWPAVHENFVGRRAAKQGAGASQARTPAHSIRPGAVQSAVAHFTPE